MKKYYYISVLFWVVFIVGLFYFGDPETTSWNKVNFPYLLEKDYTSLFSLSTKFFEINLEKDSFNYCCDVINYFGNELGFSYTQMNLIIFVFGLPVVIINLLLILILQFFEIRKLSSRI
jgi:hypothetical protein